MLAQCGDQFCTPNLRGEVEYATPSSVRVNFGIAFLDVHYPCIGPHRVLLNWIKGSDWPDLHEATEIRRLAFTAFGIPESESWEMWIGPAYDNQCLVSDNDCTVDYDPAPVPPVVAGTFTVEEAIKLQFRWDNPPRVTVRGLLITTGLGIEYLTMGINCDKAILLASDPPLDRLLMKALDSSGLIGTEIGFRGMARITGEIMELHIPMFPRMLHNLDDFVFEGKAIDLNYWKSQG